MTTHAMTTKRRLLIGLVLAVVIMAAVALVTQLSATSYTSLRDSLRAQGASVQDAGPGSQPFLRGTDHRLSVNGADVNVFEYWTTVEASLDAGRIAADGSTISPGLGPLGGSGAIIDFVAPPHWYSAGRVLVLYVGRDENVLAPLRTTLGAQFAGE